MREEIEKGRAQDIGPLSSNGVKIGNRDIFAAVVVQGEAVQHCGFIVELWDRPRADVVGFESRRLRPIAELPHVVFQVTRVHFGQHRLQYLLGWEGFAFHFRPHFGQCFDKTVFFQGTRKLGAVNHRFEDLRRIVVFFRFRK